MLKFVKYLHCIIKIAYICLIKNDKRSAKLTLFITILNNKKMKTPKTKSELAYYISMKEPYNAIALYWNHCTKKELQNEYNRLYQ